VQVNIKRWSVQVSSAPKATPTYTIGILVRKMPTLSLRRHDATVKKHRHHCRHKTNINTTSNYGFCLCFCVSVSGLMVSRWLHHRSCGQVLIWVYTHVPEMCCTRARHVLQHELANVLQPRNSILQNGPTNVATWLAFMLQNSPNKCCKTARFHVAKRTEYMLRDGLEHVATLFQMPMSAHSYSLAD
jgi:hypothetical protein